MKLQNVSTTIRTRGSDYDVLLWATRREWKLVTKLVEPRDNQIHFRFGKLDLFIAPEHAPGVYTVAAVESLKIQSSWNDTTRERYRRAKESISHLNGRERKLAKIELAKQFGLPHIQYTYEGGDTQ